MPKTRVSCPNCRQPVVADVEQLFDVNVDPSAKQRLLSGAFNLIQCQVCGYQGNLATPIVYHDAEKELLLTFVPGEMGLPRTEQERLIGSLINQVIGNLPQEKRKGYLLNPQANLTMQGLVERVLEAEGITHEMLQAQQQRMSLLRRLANMTDEAARAETAKQEDALIDAQFFGILSRLVEAAMMSGDQASANRLSELQQSLLPITTYGQQVQGQMQEIQAAVADLQAIGKELTREKLLDLLLKAPSDTRLGVLVSMARPAMDYSFFQLLSERIDRARGDGRERLVEVRTKLLEMTQEIDRQAAERQQEIRKLIEAILQAPDVAEAMKQYLQVVDELFVQEVERSLQEARKQGDLERSAKLNKVIEIIQQATTPPEVALIEDYLDLADEQARNQFLQAHEKEITPEFMEMLGSITAQVQSENDAEFAQRAMTANRQALRYAMQKNLKAG